MKIAGIIAECNPFHQGHRYIIEKAREVTQADYVVVLLSGDFVQRGAPAIQPKEIRTRDVLNGGADAVLELPVLYSSSSAEVFADGAVRILTSLGGITDLCFGSESGDLEILVKNAEYLRTEETESYRQAFRGYLKQGVSFPAARAGAAFDSDGVILLREPNDLLATQYLVSLFNLQEEKRKGITPAAIKRTRTAGAKELRADMLKKEKGVVCSNDFSEMLYYKLLESTRSRAKLSEGDLTDYLDVSEDLADKIGKCLDGFQSFDEFAARLKSKDLTYTRVSRALLHILLDVKKQDLADYRIPGYVRILGVRKDSAKVLGFLSKGDLPLLGALGQDAQKIDPHYHRMLMMDVFASELYDEVYNRKTSAEDRKIDEYRKHLIRV